MSRDLHKEAQLEDLVKESSAIVVAQKQAEKKIVYKTEFWEFELTQHEFKVIEVLGTNESILNSPKLTKDQTIFVYSPVELQRRERDRLAEKGIVKSILIRNYTPSIGADGLKTQKSLILFLTSGKSSNYPRGVDLWLVSGNAFEDVKMKKKILNLLQSFW